MDTSAWTSCEWYGHLYEPVTDDNDEPVITDDGELRRCTDCGDTYTA